MGSLHNQWSDCQKQYQYQLHYLQCTNNCMVWNETWGVPPLVSLWNDVREMRAEVPYWWHITTLIWVVLQIGRTTREICFNQPKHYPDPRSDTSSVQISALVPQISYHGETGGVAAKCWLFSQAKCGMSTLSFILSLGVNFWLQKLHDVFKQSFWSLCKQCTWGNIKGALSNL